jgi:hypothetical protein
LKDVCTYPNPLLAQNKQDILPINRLQLKIITISIAILDSVLAVAGAMSIKSAQSPNST